MSTLSWVILCGIVLVIGKVIRDLWCLWREGEF